MKKLIAIHFLLFCLMPLVYGQNLTAFKDIVKEECEDQVDGFVADLTKCMQNIFSSIRLLSLLIQSRPKVVVVTMCGSKFRECIFDFEGKLKPCVEDEKIIDEQEKALTALLNYTCKDDGKPLADFFNDGVYCFFNENVTEKMAPCTTRTQLLTTLQNLQDDESCKKAGKESLCLLDALEHCNTKEARNFIGGGLWESLRSTRCKTIIEKDYSRINSGVSVTFNLFLLIAMAFVAKFCF